MRKLVINGADTHPGANFVDQKKENIKRFVKINIFSLKLLRGLNFLYKSIRNHSYSVINAKSTTIYIYYFQFL